MKMKLIERRPEAAGVESFVFDPEEPLVWKAGQFLHYVLHHEPTDDRGSDRWFTVSTAPYERLVMVTTRLTEEKGSSFKKTLTALAVGDEIEISAVEGEFVVENASDEYIFIAGGIGSTPFRSILKQLDHEGAHIRATLLYTNRDEDFPFKRELDELAGRQPGLQIRYLAGEKLDETKLRTLLPNLLLATFFVSGPEPMVDSLHGILQAMGVAPERLKGDWFPGYLAP